jgi:hypothetical protein
LPGKTTVIRTLLLVIFALAAVGDAWAEDVAIHPSFLVAALFFATGWEPVLSERTSDGAFRDTAHDTVWHADQNDPCVLLAEAIHPSTSLFLPSSPNGPNAQIVRYDFRLFPDAANADFQQYKDAFILHLVHGAFCLAEKNSDGVVQPLAGRVCVGDLIIISNETGYRQLHALAYIQNSYCPSTLPRPPTQPY